MVLGNSKNLRRDLLVAFAPFLIWIAIIFFLSSQQGSADETSLIIGPLLNYFFPDLTETSRQSVHFFIRKTAHFAEYAVLAFFSLRAVSVVIKNNWRYPKALSIVATIAILDELNQSFEPSRTSSVYDVLLDITGGTAMLFVCLFVYRWSGRTNL